MTGSLREKRAAQRQARRSACAKHPEKALIHRTFGLWCNKCNSVPEALVRVLSETDKFKTGQPQSAAIVSRLNDKYGEMTVTSETAIVLTTPSKELMLATGREFTELVPGFGKAISEGDLMLATQLKANGFQHFHFNVLHSKLFLNYDGRVFWTKRAMGELDGGQDHRPMTEDERKGYQLEDGEVGIVATVYKLNPGAPGGRVAYTNFGRAGGAREQNPLALPAVRKKSKTGKPYVEGGNAPEMALKRAYARAMQLAAPLGVPMNTYLPGEVMQEATGEIEVIETPIAALEAGDIEPPEDGSIDTSDVHGADGTKPRARKKVSHDLATLAIEKIKKLGVSEDELTSFEFTDANKDFWFGKEAVMAMLRAGYTADEVAVAVAKVCKPAKEEPEPAVEVKTKMPKPDKHQAKPPVKTVDEETNEDVEELPWK